MKMKEVTEKTGLTDRAVRLYIDEGLACRISKNPTAEERALIFPKAMLNG